MSTAYDAVEQLDDWKEGTANASHVISFPVAQQSWAYDDAGNWTSYEVRANDNLILDQTRDHSKANQITDIDDSLSSNELACPPMMRRATPLKSPSHTTYSYDELGRLIEDKVTFPLSTDVDETIDSIEYTFDDHGRLWKVTSYGSSTAKNGVLFAYNDFDQVVNEYQNHSGAATTSDPDVVYSYDDAGSGSNSIRLESTTYPDTTAVTWDYGASGSLSDLLGRVEKIKESSTTVSSYRYLGLGTAVGVKYEAASNLERSLGTSGNNYSGLDSFGLESIKNWEK